MISNNSVPTAQEEEEENDNRTDTRNDDLDASEEASTVSLSGNSRIRM